MEENISFVYATGTLKILFVVFFSARTNRNIEKVTAVDEELWKMSKFTKKAEPAIDTRRKGGKGGPGSGKGRNGDTGDGMNGGYDPCADYGYGYGGDMDTTGGCRYEYGVGMPDMTGGYYGTGMDGLETGGQDYHFEDHGHVQDDFAGLNLNSSYNNQQEYHTHNYSDDFMNQGMNNGETYEQYVTYEN